MVIPKIHPSWVSPCLPQIPPSSLATPLSPHPHALFLRLSMNAQLSRGQLEKETRQGGCTPRITHVERGVMGYTELSVDPEVGV